MNIRKNIIKKISLISVFLFACANSTPAYVPVNADSPLGFEMDCGVYRINYTHASLSNSVSGSALSPDPTFGAGLYLTQLLPLPQYLPFAVSAQVGYHYNFPTGGLSTSYSYANLFLNSEISFDMEFTIGAGVNYSSWNRDINGGIGGQIFCGVQSSLDSYIGVKYLVLSGSNTSYGYNNSYNLSEMAFEVRHNF